MTLSERQWAQHFEASIIFDGVDSDAPGDPDSFELVTCRKCWASVRAYAAEDHADWHKRSGR